MWKIKNTNPETTGSKKSPSETNQSHLEPKPAKTVDLVFKVWAPNLNRVSDRLFLLGSIKQLGAWNIHNAAHAFPTADQHTWKVEVRNIPMHSNFEWAWLKARHNKTDIKWESKNKRTRKVESFGGVIHTIFGDEEEVFIKSATYVEVSTYRKVEDGQCLVLTGCAQSAGNWDLDKALKATEQPKSSGYWKCQLAFDSSGCLQFQWAIINKKDGQLHLMEKEKHSVCGRGTWLCAVAPWNTSRVFVEDAPICLERPDMVAGRTDVLVKTKKTRLDAIRKWLKKDPTMKLSTLMPVSQVTVPSKADSRPRNTPTKTDKEQAKRSLLSIKYNSPNSTKQADKNTKLTGLSVKIASGDKVKTPLEKLSIEEAKPSEGMALIKGKGQTLVAKTSMLDMMMEQPLVDASILRLVHVTFKDPDQGNKTDDKQRKTTLPNHEPFVPATPFMSVKETTSKQKEVKFDTTDILVAKTDELKALFNNFESNGNAIYQNPEKFKPITSATPGVRPIEAYPPPTWSMLQDMETSNLGRLKLTATQGDINKNVKTTPKAQTAIKAKPVSTSESFRHRPNVGLGFQTFAMTHGQGKEPSNLGIDDLMKSASDVMLEIKNRRMWQSKGAAAYGSKQLPPTNSTEPYTKQ